MDDLFHDPATLRDPVPTKQGVGWSHSWSGSFGEQISILHCQKLYQMGQTVQKDDTAVLLF